MGTAITKYTGPGTVIKRVALVVLLVAVVAGIVIFVIPMLNEMGVFAAIKRFFSGVFATVAEWSFVKWLSQFKLLQFVAIIAALTATAIIIRQMHNKNMCVSMGILWIVTSIGYGAAFFTVAGGTNAVCFGIMFLLANAVVVVASMTFGGNSFWKSMVICAKELLVIIPAGLTLGAIYWFAGNSSLGILMAVGQYLLLATPMVFQILFSDPVRSL